MKLDAEPSGFSPNVNVVLVVNVSVEADDDDVADIGGGTFPPDFPKLK